MRGIPMLVFLFYIAFVGAPAMVAGVNWLIAALSWVDAPLTVRNFDFTWRAIVALTVCYSAFIAEIFRAGIEAVDRGRSRRPVRSVSRPWQFFRHSLRPQALRTILPPLGNDFVSMIKDSALVSALGCRTSPNWAKSIPPAPSSSSKPIMSSPSSISP